MAHHFTAETRLTHGYISGYSHLDAWGERFEFKALASKQVREPDGYDNGGQHRLRVIGSKTKSQTKQVQALRDHYEYSGCHHEHDCCGCASTYASVTPVKRGIFSVLLTVSYNY
jgi:hypothetical protein